MINPANAWVGVLAEPPPEVVTVRRPALSLRALVSLTKPRIIELLLITTLPTMILADRGRIPALGLIVATLLGGTAAAGGANALNMYIDRDIDRLMGRTQQRPLVTGAVSPRAALVFALGLEVAAFALLATTVNLLSAGLALSATAFYIGVYTLWLKRTSRQNIVIGGAAGAVPVLVGWASVTGTVTWTPVLLFALIFVWTPPHFWALAVKYKDDYRAAGVPMLPAVASLRHTAGWILAYTFVLVGVSVAFGLVAGTGWIYLGAALALGGGFVTLAWGLVRRPTAKAAMRLFGYSITYLTVLFAAIAVDRIVHA